MKGKNRWGGVLLSLLFSLSMVIGLLPINSWAMIVPDQNGVKYDEQGYLTSTNSEALQEKIKAAEDLGVTVNVIDQTNTPVHANAKDALDAIEAIQQNNEKQIQALETKITTQKNNNQDYLNSLKTMLKTLRQKGGANSEEEWNEAQLYEFLLPGEDLLNKSEAEKLKSIAPLSVVTANKETKLIKEHIQNDGYFRIGDYIRYTKVFRDNQTGIWVDLRLTLQKIKLIHGTDDQKLRLDILDEGKPYLQYNTDDATIKVDFLENGKENPVLVRPILGFVDVDEKQGIKMDSPSNYKALVGSDITYNQEDQIYWSASPDTTEGTLRSNWAMFRPLVPINSFTYTFFAQRGSNGGVIQGIGGVSIPYATNTHESIDIHVIKQPIYHKVSYEFVGNYPKKAKLPTDATKYAVGQQLNVAADPDKISGWTFLGWFEDQTLKTPIKAHPVNTDEIIYGAWKKKHTPPTISSSVSSSLPQSSDSMSTVPGIPQTPEQPPETPNTPKPKKPNAKAPRTGELENRMWGITLLGLTAGAVGLAMVKKKKSMR